MVRTRPHSTVVVPTDAEDIAAGYTASGNMIYTDELRAGPFLLKKRLSSTNSRINAYDFEVAIDIEGTANASMQILQRDKEPSIITIDVGSSGHTIRVHVRRGMDNFLYKVINLDWDVWADTRQFNLTTATSSVIKKTAYVLHQHFMANKEINYDAIIPVDSCGEIKVNRTILGLFCDMILTAAKQDKYKNTVKDGLLVLDICGETNADLKMGVHILLDVIHCQDKMISVRQCAQLMEACQFTLAPVLMRGILDFIWKCGRETQQAFCHVIDPTKPYKEVLEGFISSNQTPAKRGAEVLDDEGEGEEEEEEEEEEE
jgi:hypothetical protein